MQACRHAAHIGNRRRAVRTMRRACPAWFGPGFQAGRAAVPPWAVRNGRNTWRPGACLRRITGCRPLGSDELLQPHPRDHNVAERLEVDARCWPVPLRHRPAQTSPRSPHDRCPRSIRAGGEFGASPADGPAEGDRLSRSHAERHQASTAPLNHFAAQQVQALDAVGALVNRVEPVVPVVLLDVVLAGVARTAEHLDRQAVGLQAPLRRPALGNGVRMSSRSSKSSRSASDSAARMRSTSLAQYSASASAPST